MCGSTFNSTPDLSVMPSTRTWGRAKKPNGFRKYLETEDEAEMRPSLLQKKQSLSILLENNMEFPEFDDLRVVEGQPQGCLWGFFDKDGNKDQLGSELCKKVKNGQDSNIIPALNLLTPEVVKEASKEIQIGKSIQLDWPLHNIEYPTFGRAPCEHVIKDLAEEGFVALDDVLTLNTQTSSQWDSLKHVSFLKTNTSIFLNAHFVAVGHSEIQTVL
jgi:hypothetical protein